MPREKRLSLFMRKSDSSNVPKEVETNVSVSVSVTTTTSDLVNMVKSRQWSEVMDHFSRNPDVAKPAAAAAAEDGAKPLLLLHEVCRYQPPLRVIEEFVRADPKSVSVMSKKNHAPLHVACRCGAPPDVINFLCQLNPILAGVQDYNGRTPLHLLCQEYTIHYNEEQRLKISLSKALIAAAKFIIAASPNTVILEDKDGKSALHYAVDDKEMDIRVLHCIQKAAAKDSASKNNDKVSPSAPAAAAGSRRRRSIIGKLGRSAIQKQSENDLVTS